MCTLGVCRSFTGCLCPIWTMSCTTLDGIPAAVVLVMPPKNATGLSYPPWSPPGSTLLMWEQMPVLHDFTRWGITKKLQHSLLENITYLGCIMFKVNALTWQDFSEISFKKKDLRLSLLPCSHIQCTICKEVLTCMFSRNTNIDYLYEWWVY